MSSWIDCSEKFPDAGENVLVYNVNDDDCIIVIAISDKAFKRFYLTEFKEYTKDVTHWMPMPSPPTRPAQ